MKDDKLSSHEVIEKLVDALSDCDCGEYEKAYKSIYEDAYGTTLSNAIIVDWVKSMAVTDGSGRENGQKWSVDATTDVGNKIAMDWNKHSKYEFYCVMNMMYSDNYKTAKAIGMNDDPIFFARLAKDWLCDEDVENKLYKYYFNVVL